MGEEADFCYGEANIIELEEEQEEIKRWEEVEQTKDLKEIREQKIEECTEEITSIFGIENSQKPHINKKIIEILKKYIK